MKTSLLSNPSGKRKSRFDTKNVVLCGVMTATLTGGKLALMSLPNIEIVTLLSALYGYVFGVLGLVSIMCFVLIESLLWGAGTWIISYLIFWPLVCALFMLMSVLRVKNRFALTGLAVVLTVFFGALTSLVDVGLFMGMFDRFWVRFGIYYMRGILFYVTHIACNLFLFFFVFEPLRRVMAKEWEKQKAKEHRRRR